jgi:hypothetical protein
MNIKEKYSIFVLVLVFIFTSKFFQSTPFENLFFQIQAIFLFFLLIFILLYFLTKLLNQSKFNKIILYFTFLIIFIPIYSAINSNFQFGQPYFYGILSQRDWLLLGVGIWIFYSLIENKVSFDSIERSFLFLIWTSLIFFSLIVLTYDPSELSDKSNFVFNTEDRGLRFKFQNFFITFGAMYYFIKFDVLRNKKYLFILMLLLIYILFVIQGRTYMLMLASTFFLYYIFNYPINKILIKGFKIISFLILGIFIISFIAPNYLDRMVTLFAQMFTVLTGEMSNDNSSNARIWTSLTVLNYFEHNDLSIYFGTGRLSHQWNNGYERLFGYFYPEDIGLLGGLFLYGILGLFLLIIIPYFWIIREIRATRNENDIFILTIKYMLVLSIIRLLQGGLYFGPDIWIVLFFILYAYNYKKGINYEGK